MTQSTINRFIVIATVVAASATPLRAADADLTAPGAQVKKLADGFKFTEGPAVAPNGDVYFTDIPNARIHKWDVTKGELSTFREDSGGANGLFFSKDGKTLYICEMNARRMAMLDLTTGKHTVLADSYDGKKLNKPNDLWPDGHGGLYFSDPGYGLKKEDTEQDGEHVYRIDVKTKKITRVADGFTRPNGLLGTADGKTLYIADAGAGKTYAYDIQSDGSLANKRLFCEQGSDGLTLDEHGNLYIVRQNIMVFNPKGEQIATIQTPKPPSNLVFGGKDRKTLYITARDGFYSIDMAVRGQ
jgi:gluconolactonase